jgi:DNA-directed RNA polymerase subunit F
MWLERLHQMSPQDQERFMNNNQRFRNLPPERQTEIRERLRRWNAMTPEQRRRITDIDRNLRNLPPEERQRLREEVIPKLQQMDPLRRQAIMRRVHALEGMSEEERAARLKDETFLQGLSAEEKAMLHDVVRFRIGAGPPPEPPQDERQ